MNECIQVFGRAADDKPFVAGKKGTVFVEKNQELTSLPENRFRCQTEGSGGKRVDLVCRRATLGTGEAQHKGSVLTYHVNFGLQAYYEWVTCLIIDWSASSFQADNFGAHPKFVDGDSCEGDSSSQLHGTQYDQSFQAPVGGSDCIACESQPSPQLHDSHENPLETSENRSSCKCEDCPSNAENNTPPSENEGAESPQQCPTPNNEIALLAAAGLGWALFAISLGVILSYIGFQKWQSQKELRTPVALSCLDFKTDKHHGKEIRITTLSASGPFFRGTTNDSDIYPVYEEPDTLCSADILSDFDGYLVPDGAETGMDRGNSRDPEVRDISA